MTLFHAKDNERAFRRSLTKFYGMKNEQHNPILPCRSSNFLEELLRSPSSSYFLSASTSGEFSGSFHKEVTRNTTKVNGGNRNPEGGKTNKKKKKVIVKRNKRRRDIRQSKVDAESLFGKVSCSFQEDSSSFKNASVSAPSYACIPFLKSPPRDKLRSSHLRTEFLVNRRKNINVAPSSSFRRSDIAWNEVFWSRQSNFFHAQPQQKGGKGARNVPQPQKRAPEAKCRCAHPVPKASTATRSTDLTAEQLFRVTSSINSSTALKLRKNGHNNRKKAPSSPRRCRHKSVAL